MPDRGAECFPALPVGKASSCPRSGCRRKTRGSFSLAFSTASLHLAQETRPVDEPVMWRIEGRPSPAGFARRGSVLRTLPIVLPESIVSPPLRAGDVVVGSAGRRRELTFIASERPCRSLFDVDARRCPRIGSRPHRPCVSRPAARFFPHRWSMVVSLATWERRGFGEAASA